MKLGFYAYDNGPALMLAFYANVAKQAGHETVVFPKQQRGYAEAHAQEFNECDAILIGLSSHQTDEELILFDRIKRPIIVVEDVPYSCLRPKAKNYTTQVYAVIVSDMSVMPKAIEFGYANLHYFGPPPHWIASYQQMMDDAPIRNALTCTKWNGVMAPLPPTDRLIYVPGTKNWTITNTMLAGVVNAAIDRFGSDGFVLGFRPHPGERPESPDDFFPHKEAMNDRITILSYADWTLDVESVHTNPQLVRAADLTIFTGGPTESIAAAYARLVTAFYTDDNVTELLRNLGQPDGKWFVAELGGTYTINGSAEIPNAIALLDSENERDKLRERQEANFLFNPLDDTISDVLLYLEDLTG